MTYPEKVNQIEKQIAELRDKQDAILKEWVEKRHPLKVGDIVTADSLLIHEKMLVTSRRVEYMAYDGIYRWFAEGPAPVPVGAFWSRPVAPEEMDYAPQEATNE
jgi:hypothetical protein